MAYNPRYYRGNPHLKSAWTKNEYTLAQIMEIKRCSEDVFYFLENYVKITTADAEVVPFKLYPYQNDFIKAMEDNRLVVLLSARQTGKTTSVAAYALWKILFNESFKILILAHKQSMAKEVLDRIKNFYEHIPFWMQHGIVECNKTQIELVNKSRITCSATTADAGRGSANSLVISDEFAAVKKNVADDFMSSVFPSISSGKKTQLVILSTAKGFNHFYHIYDGAVKKKNSFHPIKVNWRSIPGRDKKWEQSQRELLGDRFEEEHECSFLGTSNTLLSTDLIKKVESQLQNPLTTNNNLKIFEEPIKEKSYIVTVDVAEGVDNDYSVANVFKVEQNQYIQTAVFRDNTIKPELFAEKIIEIAKKYNEAYVLIELNSIGSLVAYILSEELYYQNIFTTSRGKNKQILEIGKNNNSPGVKTSVSVKNQGCMSLKNLIEKDILVIKDQVSFEEFTNFTSSGKTYGAAAGCTDDTIMTLVLLGWLVIQPTFKECKSDFVSGKGITMVNSTILNSKIYFTKPVKDNRWVDEDGNVWTDF